MDSWLHPTLVFGSKYLPAIELLKPFLLLEFEVMVKEEGFKEAFTHFQGGLLTVIESLYFAF